MAYGQAVALGADFTWRMNTTTTATTDDAWLAVKVYNDTAENLYVTTEDIATAARETGTIEDPAHTLTGIPSGYVATQIAGFANVSVPEGSSSYIAPGASYECRMKFRASAPSAPASVSGVSVAFQFPLWIRKASEMTWTRKAATYTKVVDFEWTATSSSGTITNKSPSGNNIWGELHYTGLPPAGTITASGLVGSTAGQTRVEIYVGAERRALQTSSTAVIGDPVPTLVATNPTPGGDNGKVYKIAVNGTVVVTGTIELDVEGSYAYSHNLGPFQAEGAIPDVVVDEDGNPLPVNYFDGIDHATVDESHNREDPEPVNDLGPDPKTDSSDESLSVQDIYRANRAAIEDSMHTNKPSFNFDQWAQKGSEAYSSEGMGAGTALGQGIGSMGGLMGDYQFPAPSGGTAAITLHNGAGGTIGTATPNAAAAAPVRAFMLVILTIIFFLAELSIVRGAFAGR